MKKGILVAIALALMFPALVFAGSDKAYVVVYPTSATYTADSSDDPMKTGTYTKVNESQINTSMGFSGTSTCQVIDLAAYSLDGYLSFQLQSLTSATGYPPVSGTTISAYWRVSDVDSAAAWAQATQNTIFSGINALTGATGIGYTLWANLANAQTGVSPFRFLRFEFESGVSKDFGGNGNLIPIGVLFAR